jgi:hypothetical protein
MQQRLQVLTRLADIVGLDVYPIRGASIFGNVVFVRWPAFVWQDRLRSILESAQTAGKQIWITELQAEPWLVTQRIYMDRLPNPEIQPADTDFIMSEVQADGFPNVLLWGAEFWYMRLDRFGDQRWLAAAQDLVA